MFNTKCRIGLLAIALIEQVSLGDFRASQVRVHSRRLTLDALLNPERVRVSLEVSKWGEGQIWIEAGWFQESWKISVPDSVTFISSNPSEDQLLAFLAIVLGRLDRPGFTPIKFFVGEDTATRLVESATVSISEDLSTVSFGCKWLSDQGLPNIEFSLGLPLMSEIEKRWGYKDWRSVARQWGETDPDPCRQYYFFTAKAIATGTLSLDY